VVFSFAANARGAVHMFISAKTSVTDRQILRIRAAMGVSWALELQGWYVMVLPL
jgi:hypothetical protein